MNPAEAWADLWDRLHRADFELNRDSDDPRLQGKRQGVSLAISYMRDYGGQIVRDETTYV